MKERRWKPEPKHWTIVVVVELIIYNIIYWLFHHWMIVFALHVLFLVIFYTARARWWKWWRSVPPEMTVKDAAWDHDEN